jgi:hypothetical protein
MIKVIVVYDNKDPVLGTYFEGCKKYLLSALEYQREFVNNKPHTISSLHCNKNYIGSLISSYESNPFIFVAYSHGNEKALRCGGNSYVEKNVNTHKFKNSLFYAMACSTGKELGEDLIKKKCLAFIGYKNEISGFLGDSKKNISINCDNVGIITFLSNDITIFEAFEKMKKYYTQQIDRLYEFKDMLFAGDLVENRESLVFFGEKNLKKGFFSTKRSKP